jgi:hypothetical protein
MSSILTIRMSLGSWSSLRPPQRSARKPGYEGRRRKRLVISLPLHVCPSDARYAEKEDVGEVVDFTSEGLYFTTSLLHYVPGMAVIVTFPYGERVPVQRKFMGSVVRVEHRWLGCRGVAVRLSPDAAPKAGS